MDGLGTFLGLGLWTAASLLVACLLLIIVRGFQAVLGWINVKRETSNAKLRFIRKAYLRP